MKVFVKGLAGDTTTLEVDPSNTVEEVKEMVKSPVDIHLLFKGERLVNSRTLDDYGVHAEATLHLLPAPATPAADPRETPDGLLKAAEDGDVARVESTIETPEGSGWLLSARNELEESTLGILCRNGKVDIVEAILATAEGRQSTRIQDINRNTPLMEACFYGHPECVRSILATEEGASTVNAQNLWGCTVLFIACGDDRKDIVEALLEYPQVREGINITDDNGRTPLAIARERDRTDIVDLLVKAGAKE